MMHKSDGVVHRQFATVPSLMQLYKTEHSKCWLDHANVAQRIGPAPGKLSVASADTQGTCWGWDDSTTLLCELFLFTRAAVRHSTLRHQDIKT